MKNLHIIDTEKLIIEFGKNTCQNDVDDLKLLLDDISKRYNFRFQAIPRI